MSGKRKAAEGAVVKDAEVQSPPVLLDVSLCKACGICIALCPTHVFDTAEMGEAVVARPDDCTLCLLCELHCPDFAIEVRRRPKKGSARGDEATDDDAGRVFAALAGAPRGEAAAEFGIDLPMAGGAGKSRAGPAARRRAALTSGRLRRRAPKASLRRPARAVARGRRAGCRRRS
jgi:2-oxoglutarate ferredoxin oxidoreductase subunit delta